MTDAPASFVLDYCNAIQRVFVAGSFDAYGELLADDTELHGQQLGSVVGKADVLDALQKALDAGWIAHQVLNVISIGNIVTFTFRNEMTDGPINAIGVLELNDEGKIRRATSIRAS